MSLPLSENFSGFTLVAAADGFTYCLFSNSYRLSNAFLADSFASSLSLISLDSRFFQFADFVNDWFAFLFQGFKVLLCLLKFFASRLKVAFVSFNCTERRLITSSRTSLEAISSYPTAATSVTTIKLFFNNVSKQLQ